MAKMKRITISVFLALIMCFSFSSVFTVNVNADELSSDDWEQISLDLQQGGEQSGEDFNFIKDNNGKGDDGEWILFLGIGFVAVGLLGITYAVLSSKRQRAIARRRREEYIRNLSASGRRRPSSTQQGRAKPKQYSGRPQQSQGQRRQPSPSGSARRQYDEGSQYEYIKGSSYADGGVRRSNSHSQLPPDYYDYNDGYGNSVPNRSQMPDDDMKTYTRRPSKPRKSPGYEDISSFSSSDRDIYSSSSRKNSKYINDYIDYE